MYPLLSEFSSTVTQLITTGGRRRPLVELRNSATIGCRWTVPP
jgi:hypothetical protein